MSQDSQQVQLDEIDVTAELTRRPARPPDYAAENRALVTLARQLAEAPQTILQSLAETALELCSSDSSGVSILETDGAQSQFRWHATAGKLAPLVGGTMPGDFSPCGTVLDRNATQLMAEPERYYHYISKIIPHIAEVLLIPFYRRGIVIGTVWVLFHEEGKQFDAEDARIMTSLSQFASAAVQMLSNLNASERASEDLRDARSRLDATLAAGSIGTWTWNIVNDRVYADANLRRLFSLSAEGAADCGIEHYLRAIHPADRDRVAAGIKQAVDQNADYQAEFRVVQSDGQIRWADSRGKVERDDTGRAILFPGLIMDVTERRRAEDNLRKSEEFSRSIVESTSDCLKVLDLEGKLLTVNPNGCRLMEIDDLSLWLNQSWLNFWPAGSRGLAHSAFEAARGGATAAFQGACPTAKGMEKWWDVAVSPIFNAEGKTERILAISRDITAAKRTEALLTAQTLELKKADQRKDDFLAMLAHELRNPLAAIANAAVLMTMSDDDAEVGRCKDTIHRQTKHLSRLIDDLLDVSRIHLGKVDVRCDLIDVTPILDSALQTVGPLAAERKHTVDVQLDRGNLWVNADPTRLEQIVVNLLNNAAKYTENGGHIWLSAGHEGSVIAIRVKDSGVGIPPEKLPEMFELFAQADRSSARSEGGLGIGLTVVKRLVELHGGTIRADSAGPGKGSEFVVRLPAAKRPAAKQQSKGPAATVGTTRILVVDDNPDTARSMTRLLRLMGHEVTTAHDGPEAIEAAQAHRPEVILLDIGLPGMDGYEVIKRLRQEAWGQDATIIAVSGYGQEEDRRRTRAVGFDHHLVKPIDFDALKSLLSRRGMG
jgi:PAS domain S-box-containing protein